MMFAIMTLIDAPNGSLLFGYISETQAVLLFGVFLVVLTVAIRWIMKKYETAADKAKAKR